MARVLVAGAGALGSVFGGFLRLAGHDVALLGRAPHLDAIGSGGLKIDGIWGEHRADGFSLIASSGKLHGSYDAILIAVKSYDTGAMAQSVCRHLAPSGVVISLQNGLGNVERIQAQVGPQHVLAARVIFGAVVTVPGAVRVTVYAEPVLVGIWQSEHDIALEQLARTWSDEFDSAGIPSEYCTDICAALWGKVFYNAALNPLGALLGLHYGALAANGDSRAIMDAAIDEAFAVARAEQVALPWRSADDYREVFYGRLVPSTFDHRSSMLQDLERGRRTEVDAINGEVWKRGRQHGIATPVNEVLSRLVQARTAQV